MPFNLPHALIEYTKADVNTHEKANSFNSNDVLNYPLATISWHNLIVRKMKILKNVQNGGFIDNCNHNLDRPTI